MITNSGGVTPVGAVVVVVGVVEVAVVVVEVVVDVGGVVVGVSVVDSCDVDVVVAVPVVDVGVTDDSVLLESHAATATIRMRLTMTPRQRSMMKLGSIVAPWPHGG